MVAQLAPGPHFKQFFKGADTAGQGQKGIAALGHHGLAFVHGLHDVQLVALAVGQLFIDQCLGNHAHHAPARKPSGFGHRTHEAAAAAAIHQLAAVLANPLAHRFGSVGKGRVLARSRAAIHTHGKSRFSHGKSSEKPLHPRCPRTAARPAARQRCPCPWRVWKGRATRGRCGRWRFRCRC
ncbi:hypothetical protein D3C72_1603320 [compost metagenome]